MLQPVQMAPSLAKDDLKTDTSSRKDEQFVDRALFTAPSEAEAVPSEERKQTVPMRDELKEGALDDQTVDYVTGWRLTSLVTSVTLTAFLVLLDTSIVVTAVPRITTEFHSLQDVGWYGSAYSLASAVLQPLTGKFYTYFKTRWTFLGFIFLFELGSLLCGVAVSSTMLIVGRAVAGLGSSGLVNGALTIISMAAPIEKRPLLMGICLGTAQLGLVAGPLIGGALTQFTTWRWCFYINLPIGGTAVALILLTTIPDRRIKTEGSLLQVISSKLDLNGFAILSPAALMILLAVQWGGSKYAWNSATIIGLFCGGVVMGIIFIFWEMRVGNNAMIPLDLIRQRVIWTSCLTMLFLICTVFTTAFYLPIYFQSVKDASPFGSGVDMLPVIISQLVFAILSGGLIQKVGYYMPFAVVGSVLIAVGNGFLTTFSVDTPKAKWAGYQVLSGIGRGLAMQVPIIAVQANTEQSMTPIATSLLVFGQSFGGAIILGIANAVFDNKLKDDLQSRVPDQLAILVIQAGARGVRSVTPKSYLPAVLNAYSKAVDATFYITVAGAVCMFFSSWGIGWKDIRKKKATKADQV
ncbi:major facilitator superfamily domain-containing protein [Trichoderma chlorosporum]